jgi:hypothetical protein
MMMICILVLCGLVGPHGTKTQDIIFATTVKTSNLKHTVHTDSKEI